MASSRTRPMVGVSSSLSIPCIASLPFVKGHRFTPSLGLDTAITEPVMDAADVNSANAQTASLQSGMFQLGAAGISAMGGGGGGKGGTTNNYY